MMFPETNRELVSLQMDGWKMRFPFGMAYFQVQAVSFREGKLAEKIPDSLLLSLVSYPNFRWKFPPVKMVKLKMNEPGDDTVMLQTSKGF